MLNDLQGYTDQIVKKHNIPAISIAVWKDNKLHQAASGILNNETGVQATVDSVFQIGSVTKVVTASMIMQLVDQKKIELDAPVCHYIKDFQVADKRASNQVTVRQLLDHTSGLAGDFFPKKERANENLIARYVDRCQFLPQLHPVGEKHSYCNSGYVIAGRLVELLTGETWSEAVERRVIAPLSLSHSFSEPSNSLRYRCAMGHVPNSEKDTWRLTSDCYLPFSVAPAGTTLSMSATDVVTFARAHLNKGIAEGDHNKNTTDRYPSEGRWLSEAAVNHMQMSSVKLPAYSPGFATDWGLGWCIMNSFDTPVIGHDGGTHGQMSMLRLLPEHDIAFCVLTNCVKHGLYTEIFAEMMSALLETSQERFDPPKPVDSSVPLECLVGDYESLDGLVSLLVQEDELTALRSDRNSPDQWERLYLRPIDTISFVVLSQDGQHRGTMVFDEINNKGEPAYVNFGRRLFKRTKI